jgi:hypothetical protein
MRRALFLSVVLVTGCGQAPAPPAADASGQNAAKAKEMSDLLRKADAISGVNNTPAAAAPQPVAQPPAAQQPVSPQPVSKQPVASAALAAVPAEAHPVTPAKSKADVMRDQAATAFGDRLGSLRRTAEASRLKKDRYSQICQGKVALQSECQLLTTDLAEASKMIERELGDIEEAGRHARIDPGVMRELLAKYGF